MDSNDSTFFLPPYFFSLTGKPSSATADNDDDKEDFLAALTLRLTQSTLRGPYKFVSLHESHAKTAVAGSPQSTLSGFGNWSVSSNGSPNGPSQAPSPPATPYFGDIKTSDLIYAAAEQVARLKLNTHTHTHTQSSTNLVSSIKNAGFYSYPSQFQFGTEVPICKSENCFNWGRQVKVENQQIHGRGRDFHRENERFVVRPEDFLHHRRNHSQPCAPAVSAAFHGGGPAPKKQCAGTGVFLPRRHGNNSQQTHNRTEALMAQRNAILSQQRLSFSRPAERSKSHEFLLPQEWTY